MTPNFFVPEMATENDLTENVDQIYAELARLCRVKLPEVKHRIYSIEYRHNGDSWKATIGQQLRGTRYKTSRIRGQKVERETPLHDSEKVIAIFASVPYFVVTNSRYAEGVRSGWENPFMAGQPSSVTYFAEHYINQP